MNTAANCLLPLLQRGAERCEQLLLARCRQALRVEERQEWLALLLRLKAFGSCLPPEYPQRATTLRLAHLCWPLVREAAATLAPHLLVHALRLLQVLATAPACALHQQMRAELDTLLTIQTADRDQCPAALIPCLHRLDRLRRLSVLPAPANCQSGATVLAWHWQIVLDQAVSGTPAALSPGLLESWWQLWLDRVAALCRLSDWSLAYFCRTGLAARLRQCRLLAQFSGCASALERLQVLLQLLLAAHLAGGPPTPVWQRQYALALMAARQALGARPMAGNSVIEASPVPAADRAGFAAAVAAELRQGQSRLAAVQSSKDSSGSSLSGQLLPPLYRAGWLLDAAGHTSVALLLRSLWQLLAEYWRRGLPLPAPIQGLLAGLAARPGQTWPELPPALQYQWQERVLQHWPDEHKLAVALTHEQALQQLPLAAVPALLSRSLRTLTGLSQDWFAAPPPETLARLRTDLALLEQGAAALGATVLEAWCAVLRDCHAPGLHIEPSLLGQAHARLLLMLDQAAAWQDPQPDPALLQALHAALAHARQSVGSAAPPAVVPALERELQVYLSSLAEVLEKPARLALYCEGPAPPRALCPLLAAALKPLLRFLLLDGASETAARRAQRKTRITQISVRLQSGSGAWRLEVGDDCVGPSPDATVLRRLQRALPASASGLDCTNAGPAGRRFSLLLATAQARDEYHACAEPDTVMLREP